MFKKSNSLGIWLAIFYLYIAWGSTYVVLRVVVQEIPPILTSGSRNFLAGFILFMIGKFSSKDKFPEPKEWLKSGFAGILMVGIGNGFVSQVAKWVPSGFSALMSSLVPAWLVLLQWFWGKKPNLIIILGLILGFLGVASLSFSNHIALAGYENKFFLGICLLLASTLTWAWGVMLQTRAALPYSSFTISGMQLLVGGSFSLIFSFLFEDFSAYHIQNTGYFLHLSTKVVFGYFYLTIFGSILGFGVFSWVSQKANPTLVSTYTYVNPLVTIVLGNLLLGEAFHLSMILSGGLIIISVILITLGKNKS